MKTKWLDNRNPWLLPHMALVTSEKEFHTLLDERKIRSETEWIGSVALASTHAFYGTKVESGVICIVCIRPDKEIEVPMLAGILAHEATHVFDYFMEHIGETRPSNEFRAYSIQCIVYQLIETYIAQVMGRPKPVSVGKNKRSRGK